MRREEPNGSRFDVNFGTPAVMAEGVEPSAAVIAEGVEPSDPSAAAGDTADAAAANAAGAPDDTADAAAADAAGAPDDTAAAANAAGAIDDTADAAAANAAGAIDDTADAAAANAAGAPDDAALWQLEIGATLLHDLLDRAAAAHGQDVFLSGLSGLSGTAALSYAVAAARTRQTAAWLLERGVARGDRILIAARNRIEVPLLCFAAARIGALFVILHGSIKPHGLARIHRQVEPRLAVLDASTAGLAAALPETPILWLDPPADAGSASLWADIVRRPDPSELRCPVEPRSPLSLIFTSGSTGEPLGVVLSHENILFSTWAIQRRLRYRAGDVVGLFLPFSFDYGLYQVFLAAHAGASLLVQDAAEVGPDLILRLALHGVSVLPVVPTLLAAVLLLLARNRGVPDALRMITNTGDHLSASYIEEIKRRLPAVELFPMYGLTECKRVSILLPEELDAKPGSVGRPLPGTEVFVAGENGVLQAAGEGELVVRGPHVAMGYWRAEKESRRRFRRPSPAAPPDLYTGDLCRVDREGFIHFVRRRDSLLKHKGCRISPREIEEVARAMPEVLDAALIKVPAVDRLHLFVTLRDAALSADRLRGHLEMCLEPEKVPERISIVPDLPKSSSQKVDRHGLEAWAQGRE